MKVGRATKEDINAATRLVSILDAVEEGYYPPSDKEDDEETDTFFDYDDKKHLRHFYDLVMQQVRARPDGAKFYGNCGQGFVDQWGNYLSRTEARAVAEKRGQIVRNHRLDGPELFSEHLY